MKTPFILSAMFLASARLFAGIDQAVTESTAPDTYRITFTATAGTGPVAVFASSRADRIDTAQPLVASATSPVTVKVPSAQRVY